MNFKNIVWIIKAISYFVLLRSFGIIIIIVIGIIIIICISTQLSRSQVTSSVRYLEISRVSLPFLVISERYKNEVVNFYNYVNGYEFAFNSPFYIRLVVVQKFRI